jgi:glyoxylase-like metal-dependent hydrolase (beta-lactamase superfamily II)
MIIESLTVNPFAENTYILIKEKQALLVDPGYYYQAEVDQLLRLLEKHDATPIAIVLTHAHVDHIIGIPLILKIWPSLKVYIHPEEHENWDRLPETAARFGFSIAAIEAERVDLMPQVDYTLGSFCFDIRFVPGHAPGHLVFWFKEEAQLIAGDTLFRESVGRTDLFKGDFPTLASAIRTQLYTLPEKTVVHSGHGPSTTIEYEAEHNPFVRRE